MDTQGKRGKNYLPEEIDQLFTQAESSLLQVSSGLHSRNTKGLPLCERTPLDGAEARNRTGMSLRTEDFESSASTNFTTSARGKNAFPCGRSANFGAWLSGVGPVDVRGWGLR